MEPDRSHASSNGGSPRRLESWKEIAAHFGRDARTVRRWERSEALPVHRHVHGARGSVYAFSDELDRWLARRTILAGAPPGHATLSPRTNLVIGAAAGALLGLFAWVFVPEHGGDLAAGSAPGATSPSLADASVREHYQLGRYYLARRSGYRREAREHLEQVVSSAPRLAEAHAFLGEAYLREALYDPMGRAESWRRAEASARRALAIDATVSGGYATLARVVLLRDWDFEAADSASARAVELGPADPDALAARALYFRSLGRVDEAVACRERAQRADPVNPQSLVLLGDECLFARRYEEALQAYQGALALDRDYRPGLAGLADAYGRLERWVEAAEWQGRLLKVAAPKEVGAAFDEARHNRGPRAALDWLDARNIEQFLRAPEEHLWDLGYLYARLGKREEAIRFLERTFQARDPGMLQARVDPDLDSLRNDERFRQLVARVGPR